MAVLIPKHDIETQVGQVVSFCLEIQTPNFVHITMAENFQSELVPMSLLMLSAINTISICA